jgi:hypothetical protein
MKRGKEVVDIELENALIKSALGYEYTETVSELRTSAKGESPELVVVRETRKRMPPNLGSLVFALTNRMPDKWRNRRYEVESATGADVGVQIVDDIKA